jgi:GNAT superfamily N-acetyltransferase
MTTPATLPAYPVHPLQQHDHGGWLALWEGYQTFYRVQIADRVSQITWLRLHDPAEPMWGALAFDGARPVGLVHWIRHRSCWTEGDYCYLQDLFVAADARGRGAARGLIDYVYAAARAMQCARVYWLTHESNTTAMRLYDAVAERSGFVQYRKQL